MKRVKLAWIAAPALCLAAPPKKAVTAQEMDVNHDGKVSKEEFLHHWQDKHAGQEAFQHLGKRARATSPART